jgi:pyruvate/2-oxoglutarate/acetoin dehydrogenase E1 component
MASGDVAFALGTALRDALADDPSVILLGEEVREGGRFGVTAGLAALYPERVLDVVGDETALAGLALGMAHAGLRPVIELLSSDQLLAIFDQLGNEIAPQRFLSNGDFTAPLVIRVPVGRGALAGPRHSWSPEAWLAGIPGLVVVSPADPSSAYGLLRAALLSDDPVVVCEPIALYHGPLAEVVAQRMVLGRARRLRDGSDVVIVTYGATVPLALVAAERAASLGISTQVLDLGTLAPFDQGDLLAAVCACGRALVLHEGSRSAGFGAELVATITEGAFEWLVAPVLRLAAADVPASCVGEVAQAPRLEHIVAALEQLVQWV